MSINHGRADIFVTKEFLPRKSYAHAANGLLSR
jgi:hypothetical protein